jgi:chromosome segregation ATPase
MAGEEQEILPRLVDLEKLLGRLEQELRELEEGGRTLSAERADVELRLTDAERQAAGLAAQRDTLLHRGSLLQRDLGMVLLQAMADLVARESDARTALQRDLATVLARIQEPEQTVASLTDVLAKHPNLKANLTDQLARQSEAQLRWRTLRALPDKQADIVRETAQLAAVHLVPETGPDLALDDLLDRAMEGEGTGGMSETLKRAVQTVDELVRGHHIRRAD